MEFVLSGCVFLFCISIGAEVPEVSWCEAGEDAALEALMGKAKGFVNKYSYTLHLPSI